MGDETRHELERQQSSSATLKKVAESQISRFFEELQFRVFGGHTYSINVLLFGCQSRLLVSGSQDCSLKIWKLSSRRLLHSLEGHKHVVTAAALDMRTGCLASASLDGTVKLWDTEAGRLLRSLEGFNGPVTVAFDLHSGLLAIGSLDGTVKLWDAPTGTLVRVVQNDDPVWALAFDPRSGVMTTGRQNGSLSQWDSGSGTLRGIIEIHTSPIRAIAFHPSLELVAIGSEDGVVKLWDSHDKSTLRTEEAHDKSIRGLIFAPHSGILASLSEDGTAKLWDAAGRLVRTLGGATGRITAIAFDDRESLMALGTPDGSINITHSVTGENLIQLGFHANQADAVAFHPNAGLLASGFEDGVRLWSTETGRLLLELKSRTSVSVVAFHPQSGILASGSSSGAVSIWDTNNGKLLTTLKAHEKHVRAIAFDPRTGLLATGSLDGSVAVWDAISGHPLHRLPESSGPVTSLSFAPLSNALAIGSGPSPTRVTIWKPSDPRTLDTLFGEKSRRSGKDEDDIGRQLMAIQGQGPAVVFHPGNGMLAVAAGDEAVTFWDTDSKRLLYTLKVGTRLVSSIAFSADGKTLAAGGFDNTVRICDMQTGTVSRTLVGHSNWIRSIAFQPLDAPGLLASASWDHTVRVWNYRSGRLLATFLTFRDGDWISWTPTGYFIGSNIAEKLLMEFEQEDVRFPQDFFPLDNPNAEKVAASLSGQSLSATPGIPGDSEAVRGIDSTSRLLPTHPRKE
jgi:WD40 repeat protein